MKDKSNGELFAQAVNEALAPDTPQPEPETPTGPRRPAPVPEVGQATGPLDRETILRADFEQALHNMTHRL